MIDPSQLSEFWDQYASRLLLIARSFGDDAATDAVQEAFVSLATQHKCPDDPLSWLVRVTRNHLLQRIRRNTRRRNIESKQQDVSWFEEDDIWIARLQNSLDGQAVTSALLRLSSPEREIIVMHLWGEMTFADIAGIVELSRATTHRAYERGLVQLREQFQTTQDRNESPTER